MTVKLFSERGGQGEVLAELEETGIPPAALVWAASMTNDDDTKSVFLTTQYEGAAGFRDFHGAGTFDLPDLQPITHVTVKDKALYQPSAQHGG